jgi:hypothetical protein
MFQLVQRKIKKVGVDEAEKFQSYNCYDGQRPQRPKHVGILAEAMIDGTFTLGHIAIARQGWNGGEWMLANGQHQCAAILQVGAPIVAVVEEYDCQTPEDFARLYRTFDNNAVRSLSEIALPEARALKLDWGRRFISIILSGISFIEGHNGVHKSKRVEFLKKYIREGRLIHDLFKPVIFPEYRHLARGAVVAAMIMTLRKDAAEAETFWEEVRDGENLRGNSPSLRLRNYLLSTTIGVGRGVTSPSLNAAASNREMYGKCIVAWNAYRRGDPTALKFYADKPLPKIA